MAQAKKLRWTRRRCNEVETLRQLLIEIQTLDRGSGFIARVKRCIALGRKLWPSGLRNCPHFMEFLHELAMEDAPLRRDLRRAKAASDQ